MCAIKCTRAPLQEMDIAPCIHDRLGPLAIADMPHDLRMVVDIALKATVDRDAMAKSGVVMGKSFVPADLLLGVKRHVVGQHRLVDATRRSRAVDPVLTIPLEPPQASRAAHRRYLRVYYPDRRSRKL